MKPVEINISRFLRSRVCAVILMALACVSAFIPMPDIPEIGIDTGRGLLFSSPESWVTTPGASRGWALGLNLVTIGVMTMINRHYNLLRTISWFFVAMFAVMEAASPETLRVFTGGQLAVLVILWCLRLMYSSYHRRRRTKKIFMVFCLISAASMVQYGFVVFIPVMLVGSVQMRVFTLRGAIAALLGTITPWWIAFGLNPELIHQFALPVISNPLTGESIPEIIQMFLAPATALLAGLICGGANLIKILNMNARMRALHGLLSVTSIVTGIMTIIDFSNIDFYIPLLNACVACQIGYFFRINVLRRGYLCVIILLAAFTGIWIWKLIA